MPVKLAESSHWYRCRQDSPEAAHDSDLRDARKENLYPSPTSIDKQEFVNPALDRYKITELLEAASSNYKQPHESIEQYEQRLYDISVEKAKDAADFGKEVHDGIEHYPQMPLDPKLHPWITQFGNWYDSEGFTTVCSEKIAVDHDLGVAGRLDRVVSKAGKLFLPDFKTQGIRAKGKAGKKTPMYYESWPRQLSFYAVAYAKEVGMFPEIPDCMSVVIDSTEATPPYVKIWTKEEIASAYRQFVVACWRFFDKRDYWPAANGKWGPPTFNIPML